MSAQAIDFSKYEQAAPASGNIDFSKYEQQPKEQPGLMSNIGAGVLNRFGIDATPEEVSSAGRKMGEDLLNVPKSVIPQSKTDAAAMALPGVGYSVHLGDQANTLRAEDQERQKENADPNTSVKYSTPYRIGAPLAEMATGVNARGMERSANEGDQGGVLGHAAAPIVLTAAGELAGHLGSTAAENLPVGRIVKTAKTLALDAASDIPVVRKIAKVNEHWQATAPEKITPTAPPPKPTPEQLNPSLVSESRTLPGMHSPEVVRPPQVAKPSAEPIPARKGLMLKGEVADTSPKKVGSLLNDSLGGEKLKPNVSLKNQLRGVNAQPPDSLPAGHEPVQSSAIKSYKYDPQAREFTAITKDGRGYVHGDISPEQAEAFKNADSKGKAWQDIRSNGTLVGKIVNGKRVNSVSTNLRSASPTDLPPEPKPRIPGPNENMSKLGKQSLDLLARRRAIAKPNP